MKVLQLINENIINSTTQKVEFRNLYNPITCDTIKLEGKFKEDNPQLMDTTMWGIPLLFQEISHIFTDEDKIVISIKDSRGILRNHIKKEKEYKSKIRRGTLYV